MMRKLTVLVLILFCPLIVSADVLVFKSGKTVEGQITKVTDSGITFESDADILGVSYTQIRDIHESTSGRVRNSELISLARGGVEPSRPLGPMVNSKTVDVYVTSWCPYCRKLISFLNQNGIYYTAYDIEKNDFAKQNYQKYGGSGVPLVVVGGEKVIHGYDPNGVVAAIR